MTANTSYAKLKALIETVDKLIEGAKDPAHLDDLNCIVDELEGIKEGLEDFFEGKEIYSCGSEPCSDSGGCCILIIPDMFEPPTSCVNPEAFKQNDEEPECAWLLDNPGPVAGEEEIGDLPEQAGFGPGRSL